LRFSAVTSGIKEIKEVLEDAEVQFNMGEGLSYLWTKYTISTRPSKMHSALRGEGAVVLICATTENPSFEIISPLLSRSKVVVLEPLGVEDIKTILYRR